MKKKLHHAGLLAPSSILQSRLGFMQFLNFCKAEIIAERKILDCGEIKNTSWEEFADSFWKKKKMEGILEQVCHVTSVALWRGLRHWDFKNFIKLTILLFN